MPRNSIRQLDPSVADQIAAGEVVERPGAALKELLENSLDARAENISVRILGGGLEILEVLDDGLGIPAEDLPLALSRYATSKIQTAKDLIEIQSFGFRGEALAAIAAVSRIQISSAVAGAELGCEITSEHSRILEKRATARSQGTSVRVENLFGNTPARKKFLKSTASENNFCLQVIYRLAMANPQVAFSIETGLEKNYFAKTADSRERIAQVFRDGFGVPVSGSDLLPFARKKLEISAHGVILPAQFATKNSRGIFTFVNGRAVKDRVLQQAVIAAAREVSFHGEYPQLVLFLELNPDMVDVNVHPTKAEVRFREPSPFGFIYKALTEALATLRLPEASMIKQPIAHPTQDSFFSAPASQPNFENSFSQRGFSEATAESPPKATLSAAPDASYNAYRGPQILGSLKNTYIVCQESSGLLLVDQHAAHERVTYERLRKSRMGATPATAPLLIPIAVELTHSQAQMLETLFAPLARLGLHLERFGPKQIRVLELPTLLLGRDGAPQVSVANLLRNFAGALEAEEAPEDIADRFQRVLLESLASESCHGSVRAGQNLSRQECEALLTEMQATDFAAHCPHGRPTSVRLAWSDIEKLFKRRV